MYCVTAGERFVLELPSSRAILATARPSCKVLITNIQIFGCILISESFTNGTMKNVHFVRVDHVQFRLPC